MKKTAISKKNGIFARIFAFIASILFYGCSQSTFQAIPAKIVDFKGILVDGGSTSYSAHRGDMTLVVLTASWCPACRMELPSLHSLSADYYNRGLRIIMISEDETPAVAAQYKENAQIPWPTIHWNYDIMNALGNPSVIPVSYLIDKQDSIIKINVGTFSEREMRLLLEKNL